METSAGDNENSSSMERDPTRTSADNDEEQETASPRQDDLLHRQLDRDTLQAMTRSWWGSENNEGDEDGSTYGEISEGFSQLDETALEGIGGGSLAEDDDDPLRHPPVASLPPRENNEVDEKNAHRRRSPPLPINNHTSMVSLHENDIESEGSFRLPGTESEEQRPGAEAMEGRGAGQRPAWAGLNWVRQSDDSQEHGRIPGALRHSLSAAWRFRRSSDTNSLVEANAVHSAEMVVYATSVRLDQTTRTSRITLGLGLLAILLILGLAIGLTLSYTKDDTDGTAQGDTRCTLPVEEQDVFAHCACKNTTAGLDLSTKEQIYYKLIRTALVKNGVVEVEHSIDSCAPQNQCLVWMGNYERRNLTDDEVNLMLNYIEVNIQTYIMCFMYLQMDGQNWVQKDGWMNKTMPCEWYGVTCSFLSRATGLTLPSNSLNGTLPSELSRMAFLRELDLSHNPGINGTLPSEIGQASALHILDLSHNQMSGSLPDELGSLNILDRLVLSNNSFIGTIPINITNLNRMRELHFDHNNFSGTLHTQFGRLSDLEIFRVHSNRLTGTIPSELKSWERLENIDLSSNNFSGPFPEFLGSFDHLVTTFVYDTQLTGTIPEDYCFEKDPHDLVVVNCDNNLLNVKNCSCCVDKLVVCVNELPPELQDAI